MQIYIYIYVFIHSQRILNNIGSIIELFGILCEAFLFTSLNFFTITIWVQLFKNFEYSSVFTSSISKRMSEFFPEPFDANMDDVYSFPRFIRLARIYALYPSSIVLYIMCKRVQKKLSLPTTLVISLQGEAIHR